MMTWTGLVFSGASYENRRARKSNKPLGSGLLAKKHRAIRNVSVMKALKTSNLKTSIHPTLPTQDTWGGPNSVSHVH